MLQSAPRLVAQVSDLQAIHVAELQNGIWCFAETGVPVLGSGFYYLSKFSGALPIPGQIIQPFDGSPSAGAPGARWILCACGPFINLNNPPVD